jgi:ParB family chromosome partitioning protein
MQNGREDDAMAGAKGLGRGLDVLLKGLAVDRDHPEVILLRLDEVRPNPRQPRLEFDEGALADLAASIKEQGVLQPVLVRLGAGGQGYELVAGERRLRASKLAGREDIPAMVRDVTDEQSLALALIENLQRENLNALEEAKGLDQLLSAFGLSQEALAQKVGKSRSAVANSLRLLQLPDKIQDSLFHDVMTAGHARALLAISDEKAQQDVWTRIVSLGLSVREAEELAGHWKKHGTLPSQPQRSAQPAGGRRKAPLEDAMVSLGGRIRDRFGVNVKLGGDGGRGKITFSYSSPEELAALLKKWGVPDA